MTSMPYICRHPKYISVCVCIYIYIMQRQIHKLTYTNIHPNVQALLHKRLLAKDLMQISVDQKDGIALLCQNGREQIGEVFLRVRYTDDIDLFSMWACLILCREVASSSLVMVVVVVPFVVHC